jgi:hypothetical protein
MTTQRLQSTTMQEEEGAGGRAEGGADPGEGERGEKGVGGGGFFRFFGFFYFFVERGGTFHVHL